MSHRIEMAMLPDSPDFQHGAMAIWIRLTRIRRHLQRTVERRLKRVGLPPLIWHDALLLLASRPGRELSASDLEQGLSLRQYQVSRLTERLAGGGLIKCRRLPIVGRPVLIRLTERGHDLQQRMAEIHASAVYSEITRQFSEEEASLLIELLSRLDCLPVSHPKTEAENAGKSRYPSGGVRRLDAPKPAHRNTVL